MIAVADGGCYLTFLAFTVLTSMVLWFYGSDYRSQVQADRQAPGRQAGSSQAVRLKSGSSQAVRLKSGSVMMEALERTFVHRPIRI